jgi:hypothetical protein
MSRPDPIALLCQLRREAEGPDAEPRLRNLLASSPEARLVHLALGELERESHVRAGDEVLLSAISEQAILEAAEPPPRDSHVTQSPMLSVLRKGTRVHARLRLALAVAAAIVMMGGAAYGLRATGHLLGLSLGPSSSAIPSASARPSVVPRRVAPPRVPTVPRDPPLAPPQSPPVPSDTPEKASPVAHPRATPLIAPGPLGAPPPSRASALFSDANAARRAGREHDAAALYRQLLLTYPAAREAPPSRLALAKLLRAKSPEAALAQFEALARAATPLRAEALWGIASTAQALGRRAKEEQALLDLVQEFPTSPYASAARARLGDAHR